MYDRSQLKRGTLEGCILHIVGVQPAYGYEIVSRLAAFGFSEVAEGTIYPLLMRLEKKRMVEGEYRASPFGPRRKYYSPTPEGRQQLEEFMACWRQTRQAVDTVLEWRGDDVEK